MKAKNSLLVETVRPALLIAVFIYSIAVFMINSDSAMQMSDYFYWIIPTAIVFYFARKILHISRLKYCHKCKNDFKPLEKVVTFQNNKYEEVTCVYHSQCLPRFSQETKIYLRTCLFTKSSSY